MTQLLIRDTLVLMLTATIDPGRTPMVARADPQTRLNDYMGALKVWLESGVSTVVFVENSGYDLGQLIEIAGRYPSVRTDFISLPPSIEIYEKGKGFGEVTMIESAFHQSAILRGAGHVAKCTGRLTVINIAEVLSRIERSKADVFCTLKQNLSFADSRFFVARPTLFMEHLVARKDVVDDRTGMYFEHALAQAVAENVSKGGRWQCFPVFPYISGVSGTFGTRMTDRPWVRAGKVLYNAVRRYVYEH